MKETLRSILSGIDHGVRRVHFDVNPDLDATTLIAGTGRSGTAWVANIVNYRNDARYMFEPFHPYKVPLCAGFRYRQYLRPENQDDRFCGPARAILTGRIRSDWIDQFNRRLFSKRRIVKEIRANLLLKWIKTQFRPVKIVLVLRHPCADASSRLHLEWQSHLDELLSQDELVRDHLAPFAGEIEQAKTQFEKHVFLWCIENFVPLRQFAPGDWHVTFYENLCERPRFEIDRLFAFLERSYDRRIFGALKQPSELSREESAIVRGGSLVDSWRRVVSEEQRRRALDIVKLFGLDAIYGDRSTPDVEAVRELHGGRSGLSTEAHL
jgi:sulfotransferase family protein